MTHTYDERGNLIEMRIAEPEGEPSLSGGIENYSYRYDSVGNRVEETAHKRDGTVPKRSRYS
jgi:hypothetical protein